MAHVARNLTDPVDGFLGNTTLLICERDTKYTAAFKKTLENAGTKTALTPYGAPNYNAYAERFVLSIKSECLSKMIFFGEASLRRAINEYAAHYNADRPDQSLGNATIEKSEQGTGEIECNERLGGLLKSYRRAAQVRQFSIRARVPWRRWARGVPPELHRAARSPCLCARYALFLFLDRTGFYVKAPEKEPQRGDWAASDRSTMAGISGLEARSALNSRLFN